MGASFAKVLIGAVVPLALLAALPVEADVPSLSDQLTAALDVYAHHEAIDAPDARAEGRVDRALALDTDDATAPLPRAQLPAHGVDTPAPASLDASSDAIVPAPGAIAASPVDGAASAVSGLGADLRASAGPVRATVGVHEGGVSIDAPVAGIQASAADLLSLHVGHVDLGVRFDLSRLFDTLLPADRVPAEATGAPASSLVPASTGPSQLAAPARAQASAGGVATQIAAAAAIAAVALVQSEGLFGGLRRFWPVIPLYARIPRERVLEHATRQQVYDLLRARPGLSLEDVADHLRLSRSTARHHLRTLEEAGLVRHAIDGRCRIHFPCGLETQAVRMHVLDHPARARILQLVTERPLSLVELSAVLHANVGSVHFHLRKLSEAGLIERVENGSVRYAPAGAV